MSEEMLTLDNKLQLGSVTGKIGGLTTAICKYTREESYLHSLRLVKLMPENGTREPRTYREARAFLKAVMQDCLKVIQDFEERE